MKKLKWKEVCVTRHALLLLCSSLALILVELFLITLLLFFGSYPTRIYATQLYRAMIEYIMLDITIAVIGAFLVDLAMREKVN